MESFQKIAQMIQSARTWLDRAEESYQNANPVRGELDLHLAQAEIQRACETSRQLVNDMSTIEISKNREPVPTWLRYYPLGAVASIIGMMLWMGVWVATYSDGSEKRARTLVGASIWNRSVMMEAVNSSASVRQELTAVSEKAKVTKNVESYPQKNAVKRRTETTIANSTVVRKPSHVKSRVYTASSNDDTSIYDYDLPEARDNQWHTASVSGWGEEQMVRESVPSFSNR